MFPATSILPEAFGVKWGMSRDQCLSLLRKTHGGQLSSDGSVVVLTQNGGPRIEMSFDAQGKLEATTMVLRQSRHWFVDYDPDEIDSTWKEYLDYYHSVVGYHDKVLGPSQFSGDNAMEGYPKNTYDTLVTYWDHPRGRILVGIDHLEQRYPVVVRVACQRTGQVETSLDHSRQRVPPLRLSHIVPNALGLKWGDSRERCLARFRASLLREAPHMLCITLDLQNETYELSLWFDDQKDLEHIEAIVLESQWFWDRSMDEILAISEEYHIYYEDLVELHMEKLGSPDFSGNYKDPGFPESRYSGQASELVYWCRPEGRMQIGVGQEDRETPVFVKLACYGV